MTDNVFCWVCDKKFSIDYEEYYDAKEETVFTIVRCPFCKALNAIAYSISVDFDAQKPTEEDLELEPEDEICLGGIPIK